jgi:Ras family protein T1
VPCRVGPLASTDVPFVRPRRTQVRIAPEDTADELALFINDSASDEDFGQLQDQLKSADVVVVVYAVDMPETFERVKAFWLPQLTAAFSGPIIVAGNKSDLSESSDELEKRVRPILEGHPRVDACLEVSAKTNVRVADLFYFAQHAVVYPVYPLFETRTKTLTGPFRTALTRVFRHFDQDHDGMLSDVELNNFQEDCFGARLPADDLEGFKLVLQKEAVGYVTPQGVTLAGLQFLFKLFIQRNRPETSWLVLRKFGYDDKLELQLSDADLHIHAAPDQSVELSKKALDFLSRWAAPLPPGPGLRGRTSRARIQGVPPVRCGRRRHAVQRRAGPGVLRVSRHEPAALAGL